MVMKTTEEMKQMKYDELRMEEEIAYKYWRKVVTFKDAAKYTEEYE